MGMGNFGDVPGNLTLRNFLRNILSVSILAVLVDALITHLDVNTIGVMNL